MDGFDGGILTVYSLSQASLKQVRKRKNEKTASQ